MEPAAPVRRAAEDMLWSVTLDLGLRAPGEPPRQSVRFRTAAELGVRARGLYHTDTDEVDLLDTLDPATAAYILAHEVRHAWQNRHWSQADFWNDRLREGDATAYGYDARDRFHRPERYSRHARPGGAVAPTPSPAETPRERPQVRHLAVAA